MLCFVLVSQLYFSLVLSFVVALKNRKQNNENIRNRKNKIAGVLSSFGAEIYK